MKKVILIAAVLSSLFISTSLRAQDWKSLLDSCRKAGEDYKFDISLEWALKAEDAARKVLKDIDTNFIQIYTSVYLSCYYLGKTDSAVIYSKKTVGLIGKTIGKNGPDYALEIGNLGLFYMDISQFDSAEACLVESLEIYRRSFSGDSNALALKINNLAVFYYRLGKYKKAEELYMEALQIRRNIFKEAHPDLATSLNNLGMLYLGMGEYDKAEEMLLESLEQKKAINDENKSTLIAAYNNLASTYRKTGKLKKAEEFYKIALEIGRDFYESDHPDLASSINNMAFIYEYTSQFEKAEPLYMEALQMYRNLYKGDNHNLSLVINNIAAYYKYRGNFEKAEPLYIEALEMNRRIYKSDHLQIAASLNNLATFYASLGRYNEAEPLYIESLEMKKRLLPEKHPEIAILINNLAVFYKQIGNYVKAETYYKESLEIRRHFFKTDTPELSIGILNLAVFFNDMGRLEEAKILYDSALAMDRRIYSGDDIKLANSIGNLATFYNDIDSLKKAEALFIEALDMRRRLFKTDNPELAVSINNLGSFYQDIEKYDKAENLYLEALEMRRRLFKSDHPDLALSLNNLGELYKDMGEFEKAGPYYQESLSMLKRLYKTPHPSIAMSLGNKAKFHEIINQYDQAENLYKECLAQYWESLNNYFPVLSEKEKGQYWNTINKNFKSFNGFAIKRYKSNPSIIRDMFDYQLLTKGILLNSTMKVRNRIMSSGDTNTIKLFENWKARKNLLAQYLKLSSSTLESEKINLDSLVKLTNENEKQLSLLSETFKDEYNKQSYKVADIAGALKNNEAAIEIVRFRLFEKIQTDSVYYAAIILFKSNDSVNISQPLVFKNGNALENELFQKYYFNILDKKRDIYSYGHFWEPISKILDSNGITKVYISPDGVFNKVNLLTLYNPDSKEYVIDGIDIEIVGSSRDMVNKKEPKNSVRSAALFGDPQYGPENKDANQKNTIPRLPGTKKEIQDIARLLDENGWNNIIYTDSMATESAVKGLNSPGILHIATHGQFQAGDITGSPAEKYNNPLLRSKLVFAGAGRAQNSQTVENIFEDDGFLTAYEAMNLNLDSTELVVLSACETALGDIHNGEGVYGLQRAFHVAGADCLIMSLWIVNDVATQQLMSRFYKYWLNGMSKREAFAKAQKDMKRLLRHPYYWGAFIMIGD